MSLRTVPLELKVANRLIKQWHRHHKECVGHRFSIGAFDTRQNKLVGAVIVGRPVARNINHLKTLEVTRLVSDGTKNVCSFLYAAAARVGKELGYEKIQTYILDSETGITLVAAGWKLEELKAGGGHGWHSRAGRRNDQPENYKKRFSKQLNPPIPADVYDVYIDNSRKSQISLWNMP